MLEHLMKTYARAQGLNDTLAGNAGDAGEDGGVYSLGFGGTLCMISEENDAQGTSAALALCHLRSMPAGTADEELAAAIAQLAGLSLLAVPVYAEEAQSFGLMMRLELPGISDAAFLDWMNDVERMCRSMSGDEAHMPPAREEPAGGGPLRALFEAAGAPLEDNGEHLFWRLALPQGVIFLECDPQSGQARLRSLAAARKASAEELRAMLAFNLGLAGRGWLTEQSGLVWYCSPLPVPSPASSAACGDKTGQAASGLAHVLALHLENTRAAAACFAEKQEKADAASPADPQFHLIHSIRV